MLKQIGIIGMGPMGTELAKFAVLKKIEVLLYDINETILRRSIERIKGDLRQEVQQGTISTEDSLGAIDRIKTRTNLAEPGHCDLLIESVIEDLRVKQDLFKHLDANSRTTTILATTTSTLSIASIGSLTRNPERVIGLHFCRLIGTSPLVEVIPNFSTPKEITQTASDFIKSLDKIPIVVKDFPGFIVNRALNSLYSEALRLYTEGSATIEQIDKIVQQNLGLQSGPFQQMDEIGLDEILQTTQSIFEQFDGELRYRPSMLLRKMIQTGNSGKKKGRGFYSYEESK